MKKYIFTVAFYAFLVGCNDSPSTSTQSTAGTAAPSPKVTRTVAMPCPTGQHLVAGTREFVTDGTDDRKLQKKPYCVRD